MKCTPKLMSSVPVDRDQVAGILEAVGHSDSAASMSQPTFPRCGVDGRWKLDAVAHWIRVDYRSEASVDGASDPAAEFTLEQMLQAGTCCSETRLEPLQRQLRLAAWLELSPHRLPEVIEALRGYHVEPGSPVDVWLCRAARLPENHQTIFNAFLGGLKCIYGETIAMAGEPAVQVAVNALRTRDDDRRWRAANALSALAGSGHRLSEDQLAFVLAVADTTHSEDVYRSLQIALGARGVRAREWQEPDDHAGTTETPR